MRRPAILLFLFTAACADTSAELGQGASVRDSAGVEVVTNRDPVWTADSNWRVSDVAVFEVGGDGSVALGEITGIVRTPSGAIAVADGRSQIIRVFAPDGRLVRSVGRRGSGSGEFQALAWLGADGDSLLAYDLVTRRITLFGAAGRVRTTQLQSQGPTLTMPLGRLDDGTWLVVAGGPTFPFAGKEGAARTDSARLLRFGGDGAIRDTLARIEWGETFGVAIGSGDNRFVAPMPRPFGRRASAVFTGSDIVVGEGSDYSVRIYDPDGTLRRIVRRPRTPTPVTPEAVAAYRATVGLPAGSRGLQARVDSALVGALDSAPFPAVMPAYERVLADADGHIWVLEYSVRRDQPRRWSVFTREGRWLGDIITPMGLRVESVGDSWVLGVSAAPDGAERVRMYSLTRPGTPAAAIRP
ncbi:MAG TPA: hypothetical protein VF037_06730 [Gemmatimonadales bacterium]